MNCALLVLRSLFELNQQIGTHAIHLYVDLAVLALRIRPFMMALSARKFLVDTCAEVLFRGVGRINSVSGSQHPGGNPIGLEESTHAN